MGIGAVKDGGLVPGLAPSWVLKLELVSAGEQGTREQEDDLPQIKTFRFS